ncbi:sigma-54-dependent transcriptional regulator [Luteibacter aegosomatissinici]|uniref:sigma-54-dependent transcriptional regulator n=1 Tax=Luteibacter aegosomatissinici TaxID=2911539 RepID=UPI001FF97C97|nr:sigma-54 dependent transcriptional regulator [Luteibacter aegosomatissinici]UPG94676.1 sigma-54 dependent transcriptional regulator [Luteibacter aegosomatissinici]
MNSPPTHAPILIIDDHADIRLAMSMLLRSEGFSVVEAASPESACAIAASQAFSCALVDLNYTADTTSGHEGLALVARLRELAPGMAQVVMTAWGSIDLAVQAMHRGAADFIEKPWNRDRLLHTLRAQLNLHDVSEENRRLRAECALHRAGTDGVCMTESSAMRRVLELVDRIAAGDANVLVLGENGTGKSMLARDIHAHSPRALCPFIRVDMGSLPEARFMDDMFGDESWQRPGRFELAHRGSLVLEEISTIPVFQQVKLLRVLEEGELERHGSGLTRRVDVRVISTTNTDLEAAARASRFRLDLLYRLNAMQVRLPALRERQEDIIPLARHFLLRECRRLGRDAARLSPFAERAMRAYPWPGNIRELEHTIERAVLATTGGEIDLDALALQRQDDAPLLLDRITLPEAEELLIQQALERNDNNLQRAADALGISRQSLYRRLDKRRLKDPFESVE